MTATFRSKPGTGSNGHVPEASIPTLEGMLLREELSQFVLREARLIDQGRYEEWAGLFAADGVYWVPAGRAQKDPLEHVSLFFDDKALIEGRVARLRHPQIHVQTPASRVCHVLSQVLLDEATVDEAYLTSASFILAEYRPQLPQSLYAGQVEHRLRRRGGGFEIVMKCVRLINCDGPMPALAVPF